MESYPALSFFLHGMDRYMTTERKQTDFVLVTFNGGEAHTLGALGYAFNMKSGAYLTCGQSLD